MRLLERMLEEPKIGSMTTKGANAGGASRATGWMLVEPVERLPGTVRRHVGRAALPQDSGDCWARDEESAAGRGTSSVLGQASVADRLGPS